jgi:hypothetical protein
MIQSSLPKIKNSKLKIQNLIISTEDFWSRQTNAQTELFEFAPFDIPATITANRPEVLAAAQLSAGRFSRASLQRADRSLRPISSDKISLKIIVKPGTDEPIPADLPEQLSYAGVDEWLTLSAGRWGHAFANLRTREAVLVLSSTLAAETRLVSRYFIDHYLLNFILTDWAMLHASCVLSADGQRLILMIAPHNTGKSTTALHLLRAGYHFLADGMALLRQVEDGFLVGGYPIGEVKLRDDVLAIFPEYSGPAVQVREHRKTVVDLRQTHPNRLAEGLITPASIHLCFVERADSVQTRAEALSPVQARPLLAENTIFWDEPQQLESNSATLQNFIRAAKLYRLILGSDPTRIIVTINKLT